MAAIFIFMLGIGTLMWIKVKNSSSPLPMYQMVDTNEPVSSSKEIYDGSLPVIQPHNFTNGHVQFDKSDSLHPILDSDSDEA